MGYLKQKDCDRILRLLERLGFQLWTNDLIHEDANGQFVVIEGLEEFREHLGGKLTITLLKSIGQGFEVNEVNLPSMLNAIHLLKERSKESGNSKVVAAQI